MNQVNRGRVLVGGIVSGVVIFFLMGFANHICMGSMWQAWMATPGGQMLQNGPRMHSLYFWFVQSMVVGLTGTAIYAGIRPRYGAGGATALWAGFLLWCAAYLGEMLNGLALRFLPHPILVGECISGLVAALVGTFIGAAIYKE